MEISLLNYKCNNIVYFVLIVLNTNKKINSKLKFYSPDLSEKICNTNPEISKEKWLRPGKCNKQEIHRQCESSVFQDMLIDKCWSDQQLPLMHLDVDLDIISDDGVELNLYPILRILENQRIHNENDENFLESEKQEVVKTSKLIFNLTNRKIVLF